MRPLSPGSEETYARVLTRAFGSADPGSWNVAEQLPALRKWPDSQLDILRSAVKRVAGERAGPVLNALPAKRYQTRKEVQIPGEADSQAYEQAAALLPNGKRTVALLALKLGFRGREIYQLRREAVSEACRSGQLRIQRKGGKEQVFPCGPRVRELLAELLKLKPKVPQALAAREGLNRKTWQTVGEVLSCGEPPAQYQAYRALVRSVAEAAGLPAPRPHALRHAFATRLARDGASMPVIQRALGHANIRTTLRYIHVEDSDVARYIRD